MYRRRPADAMATHAAAPAANRARPARTERGSYERRTSVRPAGIQPPTKAWLTVSSASVAPAASRAVQPGQSGIDVATSVRRGAWLRMTRSVPDARSVRAAGPFSASAAHSGEDSHAVAAKSEAP